MPQHTHLTTVRRVIDGDSLTIWIDKEVREVRLYNVKTVADRVMDSK